MYETLAISLPTVLEQMVGRVTVKGCDDRLHRWSKKLLRHAEVELTVTGLEKLDPKKSYLFMSNHQSHYDIPSLFAAWPGSMRMVTKIELTRVPIWGGALIASGFIAVDRSNREQAIKSLELAKENLKKGISVWIAPEGTRSRTGQLGPFKKGGFILAQDMGLPIVPVGISGTRAILPAKKAKVQLGAKVRVAFGDPIASEGDRDRVMQDVRDAIILLRGDDRDE